MRDSHEVEFEAFYVQHRRHVLAYCRRRANEHQAREAADETFLVAWRRWFDIPDRHDVHRARGWLYGVAYRVLGNQRRGRRRRRALVTRLHDTASRARAGGPERTLLETEEQREVLAALDRLAARDQEVLRLATWEELGNAEIGVALGCSPEAAAQRLHRARRRLERELTGVADRSERGRA